MNAELFSAELVSAIRECISAAYVLKESEGLTSVKWFRQYIDNLLSHRHAANELFTPDLQRTFAVAYSQRIPGGSLEPPILFPEAYTSQFPSHHSAGLEWLGDVLGLMNAQLELLCGWKEISDAELWRRMREAHPFLLNIARYIERVPESFGIILAAERLAAEELIGKNKPTVVTSRSKTSRKPHTKKARELYAKGIRDIEVLHDRSGALRAGVSIGTFRQFVRRLKD